MVPHYMAMLQMVDQQMVLSLQKMAAKQQFLDDTDKERIRQSFQFPREKAAEYELRNTADRIERVYELLRIQPNVTNQEIMRQMQSLREAYEDDTKFLYLYAYPRGKSDLWLRFRHDWEAALAAFPKLADEIDKALDTYALGHNSACVFHLMRVMEVGVQRFGKRLGVPLTQLSKSGKLLDCNWGDILNRLNPKIAALPTDTPARKAKHDRLREIQAHLHGVKDAWRNPTMHPGHRDYTDAQTVDVINHVRSFMNGLACEISKR